MYTKGLQTYRLTKNLSLLLFFALTFIIPCNYVFAETDDNGSTGKERSAVTYYSYQSGSFGNYAVWTTDPSGTLHINPGNAVPGSGDHVVILNGRSVTLGDDEQEIASLKINDGGTLDIANTTDHNLGNVSGKGLLRLATNNFPGGIFGDFVSPSGGTVEYYGITEDFDFNRYEYNNLVLNFNNTSVTAKVTADITINGDLAVENGVFQINNDTGGAARTIDITGSVHVHSDGRIRLGQAAYSHSFIVKGDFDIDGDVTFTDRTAPDYLNDGGARAHVIFDNPAADQYVTINAPATFYRIEINKGIDDTYILHLDATNEEYFNLYGPNNFQDNSPGTPPNIPNDNALGLEAGTVRLGENIIIPALASSNNYGTTTGGRNYAIDEDAMLWIDGATVYTTAYTPNSQHAKAIMSVYGKLKITSGTLIDNAWQGIGLRTTGQMIVEGGTVNTPIIRTSAEGSNHRGAYIQTGGTVDIRRDYVTYDGYAASFHLGYEGTSFTMSGGEMNILRSTPTNATYTQGRQFSFVLATAPENIDISEGTINIYVPNNRNAYFTSRGPFYNLNIIREASSEYEARIVAHPGAVIGSTTVNEPVPALPLKTLNNLSLLDEAVFSTGATNVDVYVGCNFTIESDATYNPGSNTTFFNGHEPQAFNNSGTITDGLYNLTLSNGSDLTLEGSNTYSVRGSLVIGEGTILRDNSRVINVSGNITNSGLHFKPAAGAGSIRLTGTAEQTISGNGNGSFNNFFINKTGGSVTMSNNMTVTGNLRLASNHRLYIGSNTLKLGKDARIYSAITNTEQSFTTGKMITTKGLSSDGGIKREYDSTEEFLFPFGFQADDDNFYYMLAYIGFTEPPEAYGNVASRPVNSRHPLSQEDNTVLATYWKTTAEGFSGIREESVNHRYFYDYELSDYFVRGTEANYIPGVYRNGTSWVTIDDINNVDQANNEITFDYQSTAYGEYTAGAPSAFIDIPVLFSRQDGNWDETDTWSEIEPGGEPSAITPGPNTIVKIGNDEYTHTVTISGPDKECGALFIAGGSTLDLGSTQGHNFSAITGETSSSQGTLRISSSNYFPQGDFGHFLGPDGGTVEYYGSGIVVPHTSESGLQLDQYRNLVLNHIEGEINLPDLDLVIHEDLILKGDGQASSSSASSDGNNWSLLLIKGDIVAESGTFIILEGDTKTIEVLGSVNISAGAVFRTRINTPSLFNHILKIHGSLHNNGEFDMHRENDSRVSVYFKGSEDAVIEGSGNTNFYNLFVNKGSCPEVVLTLEKPITTGISNPFLTLQNGTFRVDNPELTVTITDGETDFEIPSTAALSVNRGEVRVAYGGSGSADLHLSGRIEVLGGSMYIGNPANSTNNSIEYAAAGNPEIIAEGGELFINGQIRRPTTITGGALNYIQKGGEVFIYGKNRAANRALLEIANEGSLLEMSDGTVFFDRPASPGTSFGDVYLRPEAHDITGGELKFGLESSGANYNFRLSTSTPLWNISIGADGSNQYLTTEVLAPEILNNLQINGNSEYRAGGLDLTIGGNLVNNNNNETPGIEQGGFLAGSTSQTVIFNSEDNQVIAGNVSNLTNFANVIIRAGGSVELENSNTALRINESLLIESGALNDGENAITVAGNVLNTSSHTSPGSDGGIILAGTQNQSLSGIGGSYGNIILENANGISLLDNATINGILTFNSGSIYIDDYLLTFGENAGIEGEPGVNKMIILNGALSDQGVRKLFATGESVFTMPIGVAGKYTPASYNITESGSPGSVTVRPVNRKHPAIVHPDEEELAYYWSVDSAGFSQPFSINHTYHYLTEDVRPGETSDESYNAGMYNADKFEWTDLGNEGDPGSVISSENKITVNNVSFVAGDFTAGEHYNFTPPFDIFYSRSSGNWTDLDTWSMEGHDGPAADYYPHGNPVIIAEEHTVIINEDKRYSASLEIHGTLDCEATVFHDFGAVKGSGKIELASTSDGFFVFPGGDYDQFFENESTIVEFKGENTATLPLKPGNYYKPFQNVLFSGSGIKNMSADNMKVLGSLRILNGTTLSNTLHNKNIFLSGDWLNENISANSFRPGRGTVFVEGEETQFLNVVVTEKFYNLTMRSDAGLDLINSDAGIEITRRLNLSSGVIYSYDDMKVTLTNTSSLAAVGGNSTSFVDGPLRKRIIRGQSFNFPVGNVVEGEGRLGRIELLNASATSSPDYWTAQYFSRNPDDDGYPTDPENNLNEPLTEVSNNEYWVVDGPAGGNTNVKLRWDENSFEGVTNDPTLRSMLRVVEFDTGAEDWSEKGDEVSGSSDSGTVATTDPVSEGIFTIGVIGVTASIADLSDIEICDNDEIATIPVNFTGTAPWSLTYRTTGSGNGTVNEFTETNITSTPYNINLSGSDMGGSEGSPYSLELVAVSDNVSTGVVNTNTVEIAVLLTNKPAITGPATVGAGETRLYTTATNEGSIYNWSWDGAAGGTIHTENTHQTEITFNEGTGSYTLTLLEETGSTGCLASDALTIEVLSVPVPEINPVVANVCQGDQIEYETTYNSGNEYLWSVTGGTCIEGSCDTWTVEAGITVEWEDVGEGSIAVQERIGEDGPVGTDSHNPVVSAMPEERNLVTELEEICQGGSTTIIVESSEEDIRYQLRHGEEEIGNYVTGTGNNIDLPTGTVDALTTFNVLAYNLGCERQLNNNPQVDVLPADVEFVSNYDHTYNIICPGSEVTFTAASSNSLEITNANFIIDNVSEQDSGQLNFVYSAFDYGNIVSLEATVQGGCLVEPGSKEMYVGEGLWTGVEDEDWFTTSNWPCNDMPSNETNVEVLSVVDNMPVISSLTEEAQAGDLIVNNNATITTAGESVLSVAGKLTVNGNFYPNQGSVNFIGNNLSPQKITGDSNLNFYDIVVNTDNGIILETPVSISGNLELENGIIFSNENYMLTINSGATTNEGNENSFVDGPVRKLGDEDFIFPTGKNNRWARMEIQDISLNGGKSPFEFIAEYFDDFEDIPEDADVDEGLLLVSEIESWSLTNPGGNASARVSLYWEEADFSNISVPEALRVTYYDDSENMWMNTGGIAEYDEVTNKGKITSEDPLSSFGIITLGSSTSDNELPVELLFFEAKAPEDKVELKWATASETNNDFFTIERSVDGRNFEPLGQVSSKSNDGHSNYRLDYSFDDNNPLRGISYYRLKQTDFDGSYEYSNIEVVNFQKNSAFVVYPNPNRGEKINLISDRHNPEEKVSLTITDAYGRIVLWQFIYADPNGYINKTIIPNTKLRRGIYFVNLKGNGFNETLRLVVQ